jgi:hypothetical protein
MTVTCVICPRHSYTFAKEDTVIHPQTTEHIDVHLVRERVGYTC